MLLAIVLAALMIGAYELWARGQGMRPRLSDGPELWAEVRREVRSDAADELVILGSSRILFGIDPQAFAAASGGPRPHQLAIVGSSPLPFLEHLAADEGFTGRVLCGFTPTMFYRGLDGHDYLRRHAGDSPTRWQPWEERLERALRGRLAIRSPELGIRPVLAALLIHRAFEPVYTEVHPDRRHAHHIPPAKVARERNKRLKMYKLPPPSPAKHEAFLARIAAAVARLRARGCRVVFLRMPSDGPLRDLEDKLYPRHGYWDVLLARTGAPGLHFADHPALAAQVCPDGSHLVAAQQAEFTGALVAVLRSETDLLP